MILLMELLPKNNYDEEFSFNSNNSNKTIEVFVESIKWILNLEKVNWWFFKNEEKNLFILKLRNKEKDLNIMYQINDFNLIDDCLLKIKKNQIKKYKEINILLL